MTFKPELLSKTSWFRPSSSRWRASVTSSSLFSLFSSSVLNFVNIINVVIFRTYVQKSAIKMLVKFTPLLLWDTSTSGCLSSSSRSSSSRSSSSCSSKVSRKCHVLFEWPLMTHLKNCACIVAVGSTVLECSGIFETLLYKICRHKCEVNY